MFTTEEATVYGVYKSVWSYSINKDQETTSL